VHLLPGFLPSRDAFKEPDSGLPLKCDMCESVPPLEKPMCVDACTFGALTYEEREVVRTEAGEVKREDMEIGLEQLVKKYGSKRVLDTLSRLQRLEHQGERRG